MAVTKTHSTQATLVQRPLLAHGARAHIGPPTQDHQAQALIVRRRLTSHGTQAWLGPAVPYYAKVVVVGTPDDFADALGVAYDTPSGQGVLVEAVTYDGFTVELTIQFDSITTGAVLPARSFSRIHRARAYLLAADSEVSHDAQARLANLTTVLHDAQAILRARRTRTHGARATLMKTKSRDHLARAHLTPGDPFTDITHEAQAYIGAYGPPVAEPFTASFVGDWYDVSDYSALPVTGKAEITGGYLQLTSVDAGNTFVGVASGIDISTPDLVNIDGVMVYVELDPDAIDATQFAFFQTFGYTSGASTVSMSLTTNGGVVTIRTDADGNSEVPYDPVDHRWVGFTVTGSAVEFVTSPDGAAWTTLFTDTTVMGATAVYASLSLVFNDEGNPSPPYPFSVRYRHLND